MLAHDEESPASAEPRLTRFLELHAAWAEETKSEYEWALKTMTNLKRSHASVVGEVARLSGVSRRRVWLLKDPTKQAEVVSAVTLVLLSE